MHTNGTPYGQLAAAALVALDGTISSGNFGTTGNAVVASSVYTITLSPGIDALNACAFAQPTSGAQSASAVITSDTTVAVSVFNAAGAAADGSFYLSITRKGQN